MRVRERVCGCVNECVCVRERERSLRKPGEGHFSTLRSEREERVKKKTIPLEANSRTSLMGIPAH